MSALIDLEVEKATTEKYIAFYHYMATSLLRTEMMFGDNFHRPTFIKHLCEANEIDIDKFKEVMKFITEYAKDRPDKFKML